MWVTWLNLRLAFRVIIYL